MDMEQSKKIILVGTGELSNDIRFFIDQLQHQGFCGKILPVRTGTNPYTVVDRGNGDCNFVFVIIL